MSFFTRLLKLDRFIGIELDEDLSRALDTLVYLTADINVTREELAHRAIDEYVRRRVHAALDDDRSVKIKRVDSFRNRSGTRQLR